MIKILPEFLRILLSFLSSVTITWLLIPPIVRVVHRKKIYDVPDKRKLHNKKTPTLGGIAIFSATFLSMTLFIDFGTWQELQFVLGAAIILFLIGMKDDISIISPHSKFAAQILVTVIIVFLGNIRITNFHGLFSIYDIPRWASYLFSIVLMLAIVNSYNFIDGIDGLAAGLGIVSTIALGLWFSMAEIYPEVIVCSAMTGSLLVFFAFNVFGKKYKIFMGDTGSMLIGFIISILLVRFIEWNVVIKNQFMIYSAPAVAFAIVFVPLFDVLRIVFIRVVIHRSLTQPDKNHIHHRLVRLGYSHIKSTVILIIVNSLIIVFAFVFQELGIIRLLLLLLLIGMVLSYIPTILAKKKK